MEEDHTAERLLTAVAREEPDALRQLFVQTSPKMFAITSRICRDKALAETALQETYTAVWRRASSFDARRGTGMAWLSQIARNRAVNVENRTPKPASPETGTYQASEIMLPDLATARIDYPELDKLIRRPISPIALARLLRGRPPRRIGPTPQYVCWRPNQESAPRPE